MSNESSMQTAENLNGTNGDHETKHHKQGCTSSSLPDLTEFNVKDLDKLNLDSATVLALAQAFPDSKKKVFVKFLLERGVQPFQGCSFKRAGIVNFLTGKWTFQPNPEMELLLTLAKFAELTNAPTRLSSLARFQKVRESEEIQQSEKVQESESDAELEDKQVGSEFDEPEQPANSGKKLEKAWGKGVGYGSSYTGDVTHWDPISWKQDSLAREVEVVPVINSIVSFMKEDFAFDFISESSVIPALLNYCQNDSFHDITSKHTLYTSVFNCLFALVKNPEFLPLLFETHELTLAERLCKIGRQAEQVVKMGESVEDTTEDDSTRLANLIADVYHSLKDSIDICMASLRLSKVLTQDTTNLQPLLAKLEDIRGSLDVQEEEPAIDLLKKQDATNEDYEALMRELCFGSIEEMTEFGPHKYQKKAVRVRRKLMKRLAAEFTDLTNSLPIHHESSVFFRYCDEKMTHAQMLIIPADGTPYGAGCFIFDIMFPADYPSSPPKVNLSTTGHGAVRFNPNLYNCGKVCLSLLGTWQAHSQGEKWNPNISTFLQVAISIQSLIFVHAPFYNEPGDEDSMGTEWGDQQSRAYNVVIQSGTTKYAMIEMLEDPPAAWKDVIETHFTLQGDRALKNVTEWLGADHGDTKRLRELLSNLGTKQIESSEEATATRNIGA